MLSAHVREGFIMDYMTINIYNCRNDLIKKLLNPLRTKQTN